jgi:hypothetical protein
MIVPPRVPHGTPHRTVSDEETPQVQTISIVTFANREDYP